MNSENKPAEVLHLEGVHQAFLNLCSMSNSFRFYDRLMSIEFYGSRPEIRLFGRGNYEEIKLKRKDERISVWKFPDSITYALHKKYLTVFFYNLATQKISAIFEFPKMPTQLDSITEENATDAQKLYIQNQIESGINVGDKVKIVPEDTNSEGWLNEWTDSMKTSIGKEGKVIAVAGLMGIGVQVDFFNIDFYPYTVLKK